MRAIIALIRSSGADERDTDRILSGNARELLGLVVAATEQEGGR